MNFLHCNLCLATSVLGCSLHRFPLPFAARAGPERINENFDIEDLRYRRSSISKIFDIADTSISKYKTSISVYEFQLQLEYRSNLRYRIASISNLEVYFDIKVFSISKCCLDFDIEVLWNKRLQYQSQWTSISKSNIGPYIEVKIKCFDIEVWGLLYRDIRI